MTVTDPSAVGAACPGCGTPVHPGDAFCESCGATLETAAAVAAPDPDARVGLQATSPSAAPGQVDAATSLLSPPKAVSSAPGRCLVCGSAVLEDGFCGTCGQKAPSARDHWSETPSTWVGGVCDKGIVHSRNEDGMALASTVDVTLGVLVVCDGVTTAPDSDRASIAAARAACALLVGAGQSPESVRGGSTAGAISHWESQLRAACVEANAEAVGVARTLGNPPEPPSCTFVAGIIAGDLLAVAWCGDSRAYWLPDAGDGEQLTIDHSLGTEMIRRGMSRAEAEADSTSHTITRWLGADSIDPTPEFTARQLSEAGWLLVCSDGMWNDASSPATLRGLIDEAVADGAVGPTVIAEALAGWANLQGGHDNITASLARWEPAFESRQGPT